MERRIQYAKTSDGVSIAFWVLRHDASGLGLVQEVVGSNPTAPATGLLF
jgi:hypothetical protein